MSALTGVGAPSRLSIVRRGIVALALAVASNVLIRVVATDLFDVDAGYEHLAWRDFISTTAGVVVLAVLLRIALIRYGGRAPEIFTKIAIVVFVLSLAGPASLIASDDAADGGVGGTLGLMHVATAGAVWWLLNGSAEPEGPPAT